MLKVYFVIFAAAYLLISCGVVPVTGRKQILLVSDQDVLASSLTQYDNYMKTASKSQSADGMAMVSRVGRRIATATEDYLRKQGLSSEINNFQWEFNLFSDNQVNAFCMPGGKIVVYEGMMKLVESDDELAVVLSHEVAHAVAKHSNERMSQQVISEYGAQILNYSLSRKSELVQSLAANVYGLGSQYGVMLPFSRKHESEADYMGLALMAMAGYNPDVAVNFWRKMAAGSTASVPAFMSTHPSDEKRIRDIQKALPEIRKKFMPSGLKIKTTVPVNTEKQSTGFHFSFE